jgi:hypothetical protein
LLGVVLDGVVWPWLRAAAGIRHDPSRAAAQARRPRESGGGMKERARSTAVVRGVFRNQKLERSFQEEFRNQGACGAWVSAVQPF